MNITKIAYVGPSSFKDVAGVGRFQAGVPTEVHPNKAKSILAHWPGWFVAVMPCQCQAENAINEQIENPSEQPAEANKNKGGRPKKHPPEQPAEE